MNSRNDNFDELQRLLALKRREQPPDKFFHGFPGQVRDHLHDSAPTRPLSWNEQYGLDSPFRPVWLCGVGVLLCGLLAIGAISTRWIHPDDKDKAHGLRTAPSVSSALAGETLPDTAAPVETRSTLEPVSSATTSLLGQRSLTTVTQKTSLPLPQPTR